jgi:hypothetical protein
MQESAMRNSGVESTPTIYSRLKIKRPRREEKEKIKFLFSGLSFVWHLLLWR